MDLKVLTEGMDMLHLILKFTHTAWDQPNPNLKTIDEHQKMISKHGKTWWGRKTSISEDKFETIKEQIRLGKKTYAFLYSTKVPNSIHPDRVLWYLAEVIDISPCKPDSKQYIPPYYRSKEFESAFMFKKIKQLEFEEGKTPKVPGQTTIRYVTLVGEPKPENLFSHNQEGVKVCKNIDMSTRGEEPVTDRQNTHNGLEDRENLFMELIDLHKEVSDLKSEVIELKSYKEKYNKILQAESMFSSEKLFETWLKENMHHITNELEILDQQPRATWPDGKFGRLDLLAKNKDSGIITIIEVKTKKRDKRSSYDQFLRYTSWAKRNIKKIRDQYSLNGSSKIVDFVIITDHINDEMKAICEDHEIKLVHVFGGLGFDKVVY